MFKFTLFVKQKRVLMNVLNLDLQLLILKNKQIF